MANHSRPGASHSIAVPAATNEPASPPIDSPLTKTGTAKMLRPSRADRSGLRTYQPRIAVAQAPAAATIAPMRRSWVAPSTSRPSEENGDSARTSRMDCWVSSEPSVVTRSKAVSSTIDRGEHDDARRQGDLGRTLLGGLAHGPIVPSRPQPAASQSAAGAGVFSGSFSGLDRALSPMCAAARPREG